MKKMRKPFFLLVVVVMLMSIVISGCGSNAKTEETASNASTEASQASANEQTQAPDPFGKYSSPVTVNFFRDASAGVKFLPNESYTENVWTREYLSELGIKTVDSISAEGDDAYASKLNLLIASNNLPDLFRVKNAGQLERLINGGLVEDLTAVYNNYASPFVKEVMAKDGGAALAQGTVGGKLYAYPTQPLAESDEEYLYVRNDLIKGAGKAEPKTMEELIDAAKAVISSKKAQYIFAFGNNPYDSYMGMKGFFNGYGAFPTIWIEKDGKLVYGSVQPEMKAALVSLAQLYKDKLIDNEFVTKDNYSASQDAVGGKAVACYGMSWVNSWPLPDAYKADNKVDWRPYSLLYAQSAPEKMAQAKLAAITPSQNTYCVRKGFSNPEVVAKLHNYFMEKSYGPNVDEKKYRTDGEVNVFATAVVKGGLGDNNIDNYKMITKAIDEKNEAALETSDAKKSYDKAKAFLDGKSTDPSDMFFAKYFYGANSVFGIRDTYKTNNMFKVDKFYGGETPEMLRRMSILNKNEQEMIIKIITGKEPVEAFDSFVKSWNELGGEAITFEVNEWFNKVK